MLFSYGVVRRISIFPYMFRFPLFATASYSGISMVAHDCAASACWHYAEGNAFVLRARRFLKKGAEITISYIGDDDLFKSTHGKTFYLRQILFFRQKCFLFTRRSHLIKRKP